MTNERVCAVVNDVLDAVRDVLRKQQVTFEEYRAAFKYVIEIGEAHELGLVQDMFFNQTVCDIEMQDRQGTRSNVEGPYFLEGAPWAVDGKAKVKGDADPMLIRGVIEDLQGNPVPDVEVDLWWANPDGTYSGYTDELPKDYFRVKVKSDVQGRYSVLGSMPIEYPITTERHGPTGNLIEMLGGQGIRTKHVHQKYHKEGYAPLTTQAYFSGAAYLNEDPVKAVFDDLVYNLKEEDGIPILDLKIVLDPVK